MTSSSTPTLVQRVRDEFTRHFGAAPRLFFAPGRVNLIGAHLDYNGGDVLPLAVDRGIFVAARLRGDGRLRLRSLDQVLAVDVEAAALSSKQHAAHGWASYPLGVFQFFAAHTGQRHGVDLVFGGDLRMASGLSSSAAIEVATATALDALHGTRLDPTTLAMIAHRAETDYVGVRCGIMDQFASALGRAGHALWLHCASRTFEHVPLDARAFEVLLLDTRKPRALAATGFNQRVEECARAHAVFRRAGIDRPYLAAYFAADLARVGSAFDGVLRKRVQHVVSEMERVGAAVAALRAGDIQRLGECLSASHRSASADYEVSCPELDAITAAARACAGVFGARLTGAGFGGCAIALIAPGGAEPIAAAVAADYESRFGFAPHFEVLRAGAGPREVG